MQPVWGKEKWIHQQIRNWCDYEVGKAFNEMAIELEEKYVLVLKSLLEAKRGGIGGF